MSNKTFTTAIEGEGGSFQIEINVNEQTAWSCGWAKCYLSTNAERVYLGAETSDNLLPSLIAQLDNDTEGEYGESIFGRNAHLVRTLSEAWCGIYIAPSDSARTLLFLDALHKPIQCLGKIEVPETRWVRWRQQLEKLLNQDLVINN